MSAIHEKIKKLLALAGNNSNEHEAARAMEIASELMMRHGIEQEQLGGEKPSIKEGDYFNVDYAWYGDAAWAAARLYGVRTLRMKSRTDEKWKFVGRPQNIEAAEATFAFIILQVEGLYKAHLPKGLSQRERSAYRKDFKRGCAHRVYARACEVANQQSLPTSANAIVLHRSELEREVNDYLEERYQAPKKQVARTIKVGNGYWDGKRAGDSVDLHRSVK